MPTDLTSIPTDDLIAQAAGSPLERAIARLALPLSLALTFAAWYGIGHVFTSTILIVGTGFLASIAISLSVFWTAKYLAEFRRRNLLRELDRRFGRWSLDAYVRYYQQQLQPGEVRCLFRGNVLPAGRRYWGYLELRSDQITCAEATESTGRDYQRSGPHPWSNTERKRCEISAEQQAKICDLVAKTKGLGRRPTKIQSRDGFPASIAVIYGDGAETTLVSANLNDLIVEPNQDDCGQLLAIVAGIFCNNPRLEKIADPT